ncbi:MAG: GNAT family N-acetyltransferase [Anaerolineae bacterium]
MDTWRTTYAGIVPEDYLERLSYERGARMWREALGKQGPAGFLWVAEDVKAGVIGFVNGGPLREEVPGCPGYQGEVFAIYVLEGYHRQGVGSRLMSQAFRWLAERGMGSVLLWVLKENPSCRFYEALGGVRIAERRIAIGDADLAEVAYGWLDASVVAGLPEEGVAA